jgi:hypothetical protein
VIARAADRLPGSPTSSREGDAPKVADHQRVRMGLFHRNDPDSDDAGHTGLWIVGVAVLMGLAVAGILLFIGVMSYAFGILGLLVWIVALALLVAWIQDRRDKHRGTSATG